MQGYEEIKELKQLLDEGLITQEDFDRKKTELLNAASVDAAEAPIGSTLESCPLNSRTEKKKSKWVAGLTAIFLGCYGVHKFYLGYTTQGIILLLVSLLGLLIFVGPIVTIVISLIEGIIYLTKSDEEFYRLYVLNKKEWF